MGKCTCHDKDKKTNGLCVACTIDQMARNHYFPGKWLDTRAFEIQACDAYISPAGSRKAARLWR